MEFRPCIDIHNGRVKQIVGGSLKDDGNWAKENYVSNQDAAFYAKLYQKDKIKGGHIIMLNHKDSAYYDETKQQALSALHSYPGGLMAGGGIHTENAEEFLNAGASHVIVTSYVFLDGRVNYENLNRMKNEVGKERLVLDLSCRKREDSYYIVTDRWQKFTKEKITKELLDELMGYADEFLVHAVDVEGKASGIEKEVISILADCNNKVTYAGGIHSIEDISYIERHGKGNVNFTIGSALDLFGGSIPYNSLKKYAIK